MTPSLQSAQAAIVPSDNRGLVAAAAAVAEEGFHAVVHSAPEADDLLLATDWYWATVRFGGPVTGTATLAMPRALGHNLCASVAGIDDLRMCDESDVEEAVGEFANLTAGLWLAGITGSTTFDIDGPYVVRVDHSPDLAVSLMVNTSPVMIGIDLASTRVQ